MKNIENIVLIFFWFLLLCYCFELQRIIVQQQGIINRQFELMRSQHDTIDEQSDLFFNEIIKKL